MKNKFLIITLLLLTAVIFQTNAATLKMASLLPEGTDLDRGLKEMALEWRDITEGRIKLKIYPGGIAGGESDVIRKMRIGQIDMAVLSTSGLTAILPDTFALSLPFMLESEEELDFIVDEVTPIFDKDFQDKGFIVLAWSKTGWVNFFSKSSVIEPQDMMSMKFAGSVTQPQITDIFREAGFNVIAVDTPDVLMALQSGMVESLYAPPMAAASYQWFALADNMLDMKISPVIGGIVISERAWKKIPDRYKEELISSAEKMAGGFYREAVKIEEQALDVMLANGLKINQPGNNTINAWRNLIGDYEMIVGENKFVSTESYNKVKEMLQEFRSR